MQPLIRNHSYLNHRYPVGLNSPVHAREGVGGARGKNLEHLVKVAFLCWSFLELYIFATTNRKSFIVGPKVPYRTLPHPPLPLPTHPYLPYFYTILPYPTPPLPLLPYPTLTYPYPSCPAPPHPIPTLPYTPCPYPYPFILPFYPTLPYPTPTLLPYPHPSPTQPNHSPTL